MGGSRLHIFSSVSVHSIINCIVDDYGWENVTVHPSYDCHVADFPIYTLYFIFPDTNPP